MKYFILISVLFFFNTFIIAQLNPGRGYEMDYNKDFIKHQIHTFQNELNLKSGKKFNSIIKRDTSLNLKELRPYLNSTFHSIEIEVIDVVESKNSASVVCRNKIYLDNNKEFSFDNTFKMNKNKNKWIFGDTGKFLLTQANNSKNYLNTSTVSTADYNIITPFVDDRAYILDAQLSSPETFEINANLALNYLGVQLYGWDSEIDVAIYDYSSNPDNTVNAAIFTLDSKWADILYSKTGSSDIKFYGGNTGEITFGKPVSIDVNEFGQVYVLDNDHDKIYKFQYSYSNNQLTYLGELNIPNYTLQDPMDLDYCSNETADYQSDDFILVTDALRKSILKIGLDGSIIAEYKTYNYNGTTYNIGYPTRLSKNWDLQFIDASKNIVIAGEMNSSNSIDCYSVSKLPDNYKPSDISMDASFNIIVTDSKGLIHKFDFYGNYICSYSNANYPFYQTQRISNALLTNPVHGILPFFVNDSWSQTKGSKRLLPGADALDLQVTDKGSYYETKCLFTDKCYYKLEIIINSNNSVVKSLTSITAIGGETTTFNVYKNELTNGTYKFRVSVLPYYNDRYGNYAVGWTSRETTFSYSSVLAFATISGPVSLAPNENGYYTASVTGGTPPLSFNWYCRYPSTPLPKTSSLNKPPAGTWFMLSDHNSQITRSDIQNFDIKCIVYDNLNSNVTSNIINVTVGSGGFIPLNANLPEKDALLQNSPNPFNPSTHIQFAIKQDGFVTVKVYDLLGRIVATLVDENKPAGFYTINFDASRLSSGIYFYTIKTNGFYDRKKMIVLK